MTFEQLTQGRWAGRQLTFVKYRGHYYWYSTTDILIDAALNEVWPKA